MAPSFRLRSTRASKRGMTLIEVMVASAIAAIIILAAMSIMVSMTTLRHQGRKRLERMTQAFTAMAVVERTLLNAGYHYPSPRFAMRTRNNVGVGADIDGIPVGVQPACGRPLCIVPGSDVLEVTEGTPNPFGIVLSIPGTADGGSDVDVRFPYQGGPVNLGDTSVRMFLFGSRDGRSCLARGSYNGISLNVTMLDRDGDAVGPTYYADNFGYQCPAVDMSISASELRNRFMVLENTAGEFGLYQQAAGPTGPYGLPVEVAYGIDNMQVMPLLLQGDSGFLANCTGGVCRCNAMGSDCVFDGGTSTMEFMHTSRIVGAQVAVSARGDVEQRIENFATTPTTRNRLGDETIAGDRRVRVEQTQSYMFRNFAQVQP